MGNSAFLALEAAFELSLRSISWGMWLFKMLVESNWRIRCLNNFMAYNRRCLGLG